MVGPLPSRSRLGSISPLAGARGSDRLRFSSDTPSFTVAARRVLSLSRITRYTSIHSTRFLALTSAVTFILGLVVFGRLRYDWIKHIVGWRHDGRVWQYALPAAAGIALVIASRRSLRALTKFQVLQVMQRLSLAGIVGVCLAAAQWAFAPASPWLLYAWMVLLGWAGWLISRDVRLKETSSKKSLALVVAVTAGMIFMHASLQFRMWHDLSYGYHDIGLFVRALHNAAHGQGLWVDSLDRSILGEHAFIALWVLVPLCKLGADPFTVVVSASSILLNGSAVIVFWYVRKRFASNADAVIAAMAWLMLPWFGCLIFAHSYGFHAIYMAVPLLLAGLALTELNRYRSAAILMLVAMTIREDVALTVAAWSIFVFCVKRRRFLASWVLAASVIYFLAAVYVIIPHFRGSSYPHIASYFLNDVGRHVSLHRLPVNLSFLFTLFMPLAALSFRYWKLLLVSIPSLAETILTTNNELHNMCFQYYTPAIAVLFVSSVGTLKRGVAPCGCSALEAFSRVSPSTHAQPSGADAKSGRSVHSGLCLLICAVIGQVYFGLGPISNNPANPYSSAGLRSQTSRIAHLRNLIPQDSSITASYRIASQFLDYRRLWTVQDEKLGDCVIIDDRDNWDASAPRAAVIRAQRQGDYRPLFADYHLVVLVKDRDLPCDVQSFMPTDVPADFRITTYELGHGIEMVAQRITMGKQLEGNHRQWKVSIIWKTRQPTENDYRFGLSLGKTDKRWGPFFFARGAFPTAIWTPGRLYRDDVDIILPENPPAELRSIEPVLLH